MTSLFSLVYVTELLQFLFALSPVWIYLYEHLEEYFLLKEFLHVPAGLGSYTF